MTERVQVKNIQTPLCKYRNDPLIPSRNPDCAIRTANAEDIDTSCDHPNCSTSNCPRAIVEQSWRPWVPINFDDF